MIPLKDFLAGRISQPPHRLPQLSLMHTANGEDFVSILKSREILASKCTVFDGEKLVYFFVGRPAYKTSIVFDPSYWQLPAVFIFGSLSHLTPHRVFPFDSGAFSDERFQQIIGKIELEAFECGGSPELLDALIETFFSDPERYRKASPVSYESISAIIGTNAGQYIPLYLAKLYNHQFNRQIDDRARLIEVQFAESIELATPSLKGVVCCREWLRDPLIKAAIDSLDCKILTYSLLPLSSSSYYAKIYELADELC